MSRRSRCDKLWPKSHLRRLVAYKHLTCVHELQASMTAPNSSSFYLERTPPRWQCSSSPFFIRLPRALSCRLMTISPVMLVSPADATTQDEYQNSHAQINIYMSMLTPSESSQTAFVHAHRILISTNVASLSSSRRVTKEPVASLSPVLPARLA